MWVYFVVGILMFAVGFLVGVRWSAAQFKLALDELVSESEEERRYSDNEFTAVFQEYIEKELELIKK